MVMAQEIVYIIIPVHNRQGITLKCLQQLRLQGDINQYKVVVIDDGSTDGTTQAIQKNYPEVTALPGNGHLWWTGSIKLGMEYAYKMGANYFIWLNDDTLPDPGTIQTLIDFCAKHPQSIVSAQCYSAQSKTNKTFGGQNINGLKLNLLALEPGQVAECDCVSGNLVCLPRSIVDKIGYPPSQRVPHNTGDVVYSYMAKKAGYHIYVLGSATAVGDFNASDYSWLTNEYSMVERWKIINSPKSYLYPPGLWHYATTLYGLSGIMIVVQAYVQLVLITIIRLFIPLIWLQKLSTWKNNL
jgi:GT2 family glycosyltransferase